jgi:hypothetical protein
VIFGKCGRGNLPLQNATPAVRTNLLFLSMCKFFRTLFRHAVLILSGFVLAGCASTTTTTSSTGSAPQKTVCDSYLILSMCVQDLVGDGTVDMIYFTDTKEVFMYQEHRHAQVAEVMAFHRCAVPLDAGMQATTNRILNRKNLSLTQELDITRDLIASYIAAKPSIDACNARFEDPEQVGSASTEDFSSFEPDWADE